MTEEPLMVSYREACLFLLCGSACATGCSGSSAEPVSDRDAGALLDSSADSNRDAPRDDASVLADGGADATTPPAGDRRIDPIELGRTWTYDVKVLGFFPACSAGTSTATVVEQSMLDGKTAFHVQSFCKAAGVFQYAVDGDRVFVHVGGAWIVALDAPVAEGRTWSDGLLTYRWRSKGTVTTPAGTFTECWAAETVASYTSYTVLCRGVGPVEWHYEDGSGNGYEAILVSKNFG